MTKTVLIVEPDRKIRRLLEVNLKRVGWSAFTVGTIDAAIDLAREYEVDMIAFCQRYEGIEERLQANPATRNIKRIVIPWNKKFDIKNDGSQTFEA